MHIQYLKIIQLTAFACFVKQGGGRVTFFKASKRGDVPRVEGGGGHVFLRDPKGGIKKYPVNRNENLQTPPPPPHKK